MEDLWNRALMILKYDPNMNDVLYDSICRRLKAESQTDDILILSCKDEYSMSLIKGRDPETYIRNAVRCAADRDINVHFIVEGDEVSAQTMQMVDNKLKSRIPTSSALSPEFTFDNFIVGDCNRFAHASAVAVANNPGISSRNPLYLWGNSGLGKTHLIKAIGYSIKENHKDMNVLYTTCEEFTTAFVNCLNNTAYEDFRNKYRNVDVLLIDDIQFLIGKEGTQTEFFNTFETLINNGKQIVITSDKAPKNLTELDQRLTSRFQNGLPMDIQPPDFETRKAIFLSKVKKDGLNIDDEIINYVCENITKNVRELNGAYNIINSLYILSNGVLNLETVESHMVSVISPGANKTVTKEMIIDYAAKYYGIDQKKLLSTNRSNDIFKARAVAMYLCRDLIDMKLEKIGDYFGGKKHSTVMNALNKVEQDKSLLKDIELIKKRIMDS
ncbi:MAG: chromosomal replication initiator protein DnaA [Clostridiales bacterium]|nr:chromosomal replication initiator protein DnaA [Clostridiales bacterium]